MTVLGPDWLDRPGIVDAHTHVWIDRVPGADRGAPVLDDAPAIVDELTDFRVRGGAAVIDCQPPGTGRDAERLVELSRRSGVAVVASTGFHLDHYYAPGDSPWRADAGPLRDCMVAELRDGLLTPRGARLEARAGVIKAAHPGYLDDTVSALFAAAADAAIAAGVVLLVHTERGEGLEALADLLLGFPMRASNVILCHTDKRPDRGLHRTLAEAGFLLEYDTFMRPKYEPEQRLWPLLDSMLADGFGEAIACGLDTAGARLWRHGGDAHGARAWTDMIVPQMRARGYAEPQIAALTGGNVRRCLTTSRGAGAAS